MAATTSAAVVQALFHVRAPRLERSEPGSTAGRRAVLIGVLVRMRRRLRGVGRGRCAEGGLLPVGGGVVGGVFGQR
jgi:hypothetical protein